jgi:hypothetical protein
MKIICSLIALSMCAITISSCGTYRHYAPTANPALFKEAGEVSVAGDIGMSGASAKGSVSLTNHFAVMGQYAGGFTKYRSRDYEFAAGYYFTKENYCNYFSGGITWGNNWGYQDTTYTVKSYQGHYLRPFVQWNTGVTGGKLFWNVKGDIMMGLKMSYFIYDGQYLSDGAGIHSNYTLTEPFFMWGIGSRIVHFDIIWGMPLHLTFEPLSSSGNARTLPMNFSFGMRILLGRKKTE